MVVVNGVLLPLNVSKILIMQKFLTSGKRRCKQQTPTKLHFIISQQITIIIVATITTTLNLYFLPVVAEHALHIHLCTKKTELFK